MRKILFLFLSALALTTRAANIEDTKNYEGKIVMIKAVIYADTAAANRSTSDKTIYYLYSGEDRLHAYTPAQADSAFKVDPYRFYWVVSKSPETASSQYYYLSCLKGDAYIGSTTGQNLISGNWDGVTITSTDNYLSEFPILSFDKCGVTSGLTISAYTVEGISLRFKYGSNGDRWLAVSENGLVNWVNYTNNGTTLNNVRWTSNLELTEVTTSDAWNDFGTLDAPKEYGFKVTLGRTDDGKTQVEGEDTNYYGTLKLNYAVELPDGMRAYKLSQKTNVSNAMLGLTQHTNTTSNSLDGTEKNILARETPVYLCVTHTDGDADKTKTYYLRPEKAQTITETGFSGVLRQKIFPDSVYRGASDTLTYYILTKSGGRMAFRPMKNQTLAANKAYFQWRGTDSETGAKSAFPGFYFEDDDNEPTTAITTAKADTAAPSYYDLTGRRYATRPTRAGVYICGGRKIVIFR